MSVFYCTNFSSEEMGNRASKNSVILAAIDAGFVKRVVQDNLSSTNKTNAGAFQQETCSYIRH
jgi:hypothetical protein